MVTEFRRAIVQKVDYFGGLVKKESGRSAHEYIQNKLIDIAKKKIFNQQKTINEIACELGFIYPNTFHGYSRKELGKARWNNVH